MPLLDQAGDGQTGSRSVDNGESGDATAGSNDTTAVMPDTESNSKGSTQHLSAKAALLSPLPLSGGLDVGQRSLGVTRSNTPEPMRVREKSTAGRSPRESQGLGVESNKSQGQAVLEQAGRFRLGADQRKKAGRKKGEREQARKGFAAATLRRFKAKLEGLTERHGLSGEGRRVSVLSVEEQVEKLLQQATSIDNLAQMYEGWTPWI